MNIKKLLEKQAQNFPKKIALICENEKIDFLKLKEDVFRFASYLSKLGIGPQDKISIFLPNSQEAMIAFLGVFVLGATVVPLDFMLTEEEIVNFLNHSESKILIAQPKRNIDFVRIKDKCPHLKEIILCREKIPNFIFWEEIMRYDAETFFSQIDEDNLAIILYTSGSTGHPKGVMLTYRHFDYPVRCIDYFLKISSNDVALCGGVPFSHLGGLDYILLMVCFGISIVLMERFQPLEFLRNIEKYRVTLFWIVPSMYVAILSLKGYDSFDLSSLRYAVVFGAPSSPTLLKRFHKVCPNAYLLNGWGMTETAAPNCILPPGIDKIESVGKFAPGMEVKIVDEKGNSVGVNQQGELWVRGGAVMKGYYKEPKLTEETITSEGWLKTGDIAYYDENGLFYIVGRKKDMIKVAGEVVFSSEVEEKILLHPKVKEAAVIGVPDRLRGEVPKAFVVLKEEDLDEGKLKDFLRKHLAHFKIPHYFEFVKDLPKTRTGKIDKKQLLKMEVGR